MPPKKQNAKGGKVPPLTEKKRGKKKVDDDDALLEAALANAETAKVAEEAKKKASPKKAPKPQSPTSPGTYLTSTQLEAARKLSCPELLEKGFFAPMRGMQLLSKGTAEYTKSSNDICGHLLLAMQRSDFLSQQSDKRIAKYGEVLEGIASDNDVDFPEVALHYYKVVSEAKPLFLLAPMRAASILALNLHYLEAECMLRDGLAKLKSRRTSLQIGSDERLLICKRAFLRERLWIRLKAASFGEQGRLTMCLYDELVEVNEKLPPCFNTLFALAAYNDYFCIAIHTENQAMSSDAGIPSLIPQGLPRAQARASQTDTANHQKSITFPPSQKTSSNLLPDTECTPAQLALEHPGDYAQRITAIYAREVRKSTMILAGARSELLEIESKESELEGQWDLDKRGERNIMATMRPTKDLEKISKEFLALLDGEATKRSALEQCSIEAWTLEEPRKPPPLDDVHWMAVRFNPDENLESWTNQLRSGLGLLEMQGGDLFAGMRAMEDVGDAQSVLGPLMMKSISEPDIRKVLAEVDRGYELAVKEKNHWHKLQFMQIAAERCWREVLYDQCLSYIGRYHEDYECHNVWIKQAMGAREVQNCKMEDIGFRKMEREVLWAAAVKALAVGTNSQKNSQRKEAARKSVEYLTTLQGLLQKETKTAKQDNMEQFKYNIRDLLDHVTPINGEGSLEVWKEFEPLVGPRTLPEERRIVELPDDEEEASAVELLLLEAPSQKEKNKNKKKAEKESEKKPRKKGSDENATNDSQREVPAQSAVDEAKLAKLLGRAIRELPSSEAELRQQLEDKQDRDRSSLQWRWNQLAAKFAKKAAGSKPAAAGRLKESGEEKTASINAAQTDELERILSDGGLSSSKENAISLVNDILKVIPSIFEEARCDDADVRFSQAGKPLVVPLHELAAQLFLLSGGAAALSIKRLRRYASEMLKDVVELVLAVCDRGYNCQLGKKRAPLKSFFVHINGIPSQFHTSSLSIHGSGIDKAAVKSTNLTRVLEVRPEIGMSLRVWGIQSDPMQVKLRFVAEEGFHKERLNSIYDFAEVSAGRKDT